MLQNLQKQHVWEKYTGWKDYPKHPSWQYKEAFWKGHVRCFYFIKIKVAVKCMQMFAVSFTLLGWGSKKPRQLLVYVVVPEKLTF